MSDEKDLEQLEEQINEDKLKEMVDKAIHSLLSNNRKIFSVYEQLVNEVELIQLKLDETKHELSLLIPEVDKIDSEERRLRTTLAAASREFHYNTMESVLAKQKEIRQILREKRVRENQLRKERNNLELRLKRFQAMERTAKHMVTTIGSVATFLSNQFANITASLSSLQGKVQADEKIINAHEFERLRISRELHDTVAQDLANLLWETTFCQRSLERDKKDDALESLGKIRNGVQGSIAGVRQAIFDMRPMSIDDMGLLEAIHELCQTTAERAGMKITYHLEGEEHVSIPKFKEIAIYRIVQEAINNTLHHANATLIEVKANAGKQALSIYIKDNGRGFDAQSVMKEDLNTESSHFGLLGMRERAKTIGAEFSILSSYGSGAQVRLRLPLS